MARLLLVHRYFWPDSPAYATILRSIAKRLKEDGYDVTVLSCQPSYQPGQAPAPDDEILDGVRVKRLRLIGEHKRAFLRRLLNLFLFAGNVRRHIRREQYDVVMAATTPPVLVARAAFGAARRAGSAFVYHCQDIHPEALGYSGLLNQGGIIFRLLRWIDSKTVADADRVVVLSTDMGSTLRARGVPLEAERIRVINNFQPGGNLFIDENRSRPGLGRDRPVRLMFTGNLGYFQGLDVVVDAYRALSSSELELVFVGEGAAKAALIKRAGEFAGKQIRFLDHQPVEALPDLLDSADLGLVSLAPDIIRVAYPSKTMTYLETGCPLLAIVEPESELARMIAEYQIGFIARPGDVDALTGVLAEVIGKRDELAAMRGRARLAARERFDSTRILDKWSQLYGELVAERRAA